MRVFGAIIASYKWKFIPILEEVMKKTILALALAVLVVLALGLMTCAEGENALAADYVSTSSVSSLSIASYPGKTVYGAFEQLDMSGLSLEVCFNDGTERIVQGGEIRVSYTRDNCFRVGDDSVMLSYGGKSLYLPVTVNRIDYDLSGLDLSSFSTVYNGRLQGYNRPITQIVGLDGIPLSVNISGGGINVGIYDISIDFSTDSRDYLTPESRVITMTVEPAGAEIVWESLSFVYDGKAKSPIAYYTDVSGKRVYPAVSGGATNAGKGYQARATVSDLNYEFTNTSVSYEIKKADYDFSSVVWSNDSFTYDGSKKSISASGLPSGVSVIGYSGDRGTEAGNYKAVAMLRWDEINYNAPPTLSHSWEIKKADYDMSAVSFINKSYVFDGKVHYPYLVGSMPVGRDGIRLEYSFSCGASHVSDGVVSVVISFTTLSKNYNLPEDRYASVSITPLGIEVIWGESSLNYNGEEQAPTAYSKECIINVSGGAIGAGRYVATATTENEDYYIVNDRTEYSIVRANNFWAITPADSICYEGREICLVGQSRFGSIITKYYSDAECKKEISSPTACGRYYAILSVEGNSDYTGLTSSVISFEIVEVIPVSFMAAIIKADIRAFDKLGHADIVCSVVNNDGSVLVVDSSDVTVIYQNADSLRRGDSEVRLQYGKFTLTLKVEVGYADYDLSGVSWANVSQIYSGIAKTPTLTGLPKGVSVTGYSGEAMVGAGRYTVYAILDYDKDNYNEPTVAPCEFVIEKCPIEVPIISSTYNGLVQRPRSESSLYTVVEDTKHKDAGSYPIKIQLTDPDNYCFAEREGDSAYAIFRILPATVSVEVCDMSLRWFEDVSDADYRIISGKVYDGDVIGVSTYREGERVFVHSENPNYSFEVTPGRINRLPYPTVEGGLIIFICLLALAAVVILCFRIIKNRHRLISIGAMLKCRWHNRNYKAAPPRQNINCDLKYDLNSFGRLNVTDESDLDAGGPLDDLIETKSSETVTEDNAEKDIEIGEVGFEVDAEKADSLISNSLAKSLVKREGEMVFTSGGERAIVNIDILNSSFAPGDRIDVNVLKEKGILAPEVAYYKVLAGGKINKPLMIYANDFSLTAVKMIALTGGQAIKIVTFKDKSKEEKG